MMYYKYIKLTSGDSIIAATEDNCETFKDKEFVKVMNPVQVGMMRFPRNGLLIETHVFMPWIAMSATEDVMLPTNSIVVTVDVEDKVADQYNRYILKTDTKLLTDQESDEYLTEDSIDEEDEEFNDNETDDDHRTLH